MNRQARMIITGNQDSLKWKDYGDIGFLEAARRHALRVAQWFDGEFVPDVYTIELRDADDPSIPVQTVTVSVEAVATVVNPRGEASSHTPGPWTVVDKGHGFSIEPSVCWLGSSSAHKPGENEANARLIAAAPEMLEALKLLLELIEFNEKRQGFVSAQGKIARSAITKAEGK